MAIKLTRRQKKEIEKLRDRQKATLVFSGGKKLNSDELKQRRQDIERRIAGIQSGGRVTQSDPRFKRFGPTGDSRTSTQGDGFMDQLRANTGGFATQRPQQPRVRPRENFMPKPAPILRQPMIDFAALPERNTTSQPPYRGGSIPSIFSQFLPGVGTYKQGRLEREMGFSPSLMDSLRLNTGGFPTQRAPFSPSLLGAAPVMDRGFLSRIARPQTGTIGDFRNQLFSNQALNTGLFSAPIFNRTQFSVPVGAFEAGSKPFLSNKTYNERLQEGLDAAMKENPNINAFIDPSLPLSTFNVGFGEGNLGTNLTSSPTAMEFDIFGNPRNLGADEIINRYGDTINAALQGKSYTII